MIVAEKLTRNYGKVVAVKEVSFHIKAGEIVGLLGHNGAGKTTIMKMLTGFLQPNSGKAIIDNFDVVNERQQVQQLIGYLPENSPTYGDLSVISYLEYAAELKKIPISNIPTVINEALNLTGIRDKAFSKIATLSRGYQQRVGVAQAILAHPKILILDEPTNGLDPTQIEQMRILIKDIAKTSTVIVSTHILQEVQAICDRVLIIKNGKLVLDSPLDKLQASDRIVLETSCNLEELKKVVSNIKGITAIDQLMRQQEKTNNKYMFALVTSDPTNSLDFICASVAANVVLAKHKIFSISPEKRDLETVFRNLNNLDDELNEATNHAA